MEGSNNCYWDRDLMVIRLVDWLEWTIIIWSVGVN